jgi:hypothetical protein
MAKSSDDLVNRTTNNRTGDRAAMRTKDSMR